MVVNGMDCVQALFLSMGLSESCWIDGLLVCGIPFHMRPEWLPLSQDLSASSGRFSDFLRFPRCRSFGKEHPTNTSASTSETWC